MQSGMDELLFQPTSDRPIDDYKDERERERTSDTGITPRSDPLDLAARSSL
jgi:hypothetical protein